MRRFFIKSLSYFLLAPIAALWAWRQEKAILNSGEPLTEQELDWARQLGIHETEKIRLMRKPRLSFPVPKWSIKLINSLGLQIQEAAGMSLRYGIFISTRAKRSPYLVCHELVHTLQYQQLGSMHRFMSEYLFECLYYGYANSPMEHEADELAGNILHESPS